MIANKNVSGAVGVVPPRWKKSHFVKVNSQATQTSNVCSMPDALNLSKVLYPCRWNILQGRVVQSWVSARFELRFESLKSNSVLILFVHKLMIGSSKNKRENYPRKCFWTQEKETRVKFNSGLSANRPSNNWAQKKKNAGESKDELFSG